eukprot:14004-Heterococcus_DN1.PRE.3
MPATAYSNILSHGRLQATSTTARFHIIAATRSNSSYSSVTARSFPERLDRTYAYIELRHTFDQARE